MGLFSRDSYKTANGVCLVKFEKPGELDILRVQEIFGKKQVAKSENIIVIIGKRVTAIGERAFFKASFSSIIIPKTVQSISSTAFDMNKCYSFFVESDHKPSGWAFQFKESLQNHNVTWGIDGYGITDGIVWVQKSDSIIVCGYVGAQAEFNVPDRLNGCPVTAVGDYAFLGCNIIESVSLPSGVNFVGRWAFGKCSRLKRVSFPDGVTYVGDSAFALSNAIEEITLPQGLTTVEAFTFHGCKSLTKVTVPDSVTKISFYAFMECSSLKEVTLPDSIRTIEQGVFQECTSLEGLTLPRDITYISESIFWKCTALSSITIPEYVESIGQSAFYNCSALKSIIIPKSVRQIGDNAFYSCNGIKISCEAESKPKEWSESWCEYEDNSLFSMGLPATVTWGYKPPRRKMLND